jgi:hypothetical protein
MKMIRYALILTDVTVQTVEAYLPDNYSIMARTSDGIVVKGRDVAGWTLDSYVIPRLSSGNIIAKEIDLSHPVMKQIPLGSAR